MPDPKRREFLKQLTKSTVYVAPVIYTIAAPLELIGQGMSSQHKGGSGSPGHGGGHGFGASEAPWDEPPPGSKNP